MKKIELLAMLGESKDIIDYLQRKGTVQVEKCDAPESMYYTDTDSSVSQLERLLQTAENARETISFYSPEKKKLTDSFLPRKEVELSDFYEESEVSGDYRHKKGDSRQKGRHYPRADRKRGSDSVGKA